jgi:L-ascorbate metabolism protein UlaG (beta-lactamase superfamily)
MAGAHGHDNFDGTRFFLAGHRAAAPFSDILKWQMAGGRARWPSRVENRVHQPPPHRVAGDDLLATWIGQSTVLLQTAGLNILTDPFFSERASPVAFAGPRRVRPPGVALADLPPIDLVLVSHNHYDHMDLPSLRAIARSCNPRVVAPLGNAVYIRKVMAAAHITELNWGETFHGGAASITLTPAVHWSKRGLTDTNKALWGAFAIRIGASLIYFAGDTAFGEGATFRKLHEDVGSPRLSLLPIGAYEPRWFMKHQHMDPREAVMAHQALASRTSLAIHHSTIQLTDEAIDAPARELAQAVTTVGISDNEFRLTDAGEPTWIP